MRNYVVAAGLLASNCLLAMQAHGLERSDAVKDAWIGGKLEAVYALNPHLRDFTIETSVARGVVRLTGAVSSDVDRILAGELAKGIDGVTEVHNILLLALPGRDAALPATAADRSFGVWIDDATTTASVKTKLLSDPNTDGLRIDVDTRRDVVTLSGEVASAEESALAEELARNTGAVKSVRNELVVRRAH
jgi:hyperosmotically inducible periplasmic protein